MLNFEERARGETAAAIFEMVKKKTPTEQENGAKMSTTTLLPVFAIRFRLDSVAPLGLSREKPSETKVHTNDFTFPSTEQKIWKWWFKFQSLRSNPNFFFFYIQKQGL